MKQGKIVAACKALDKLLVQDVTLPTARKLFDLRRKFQDAWDFQVQEEQKIANRHPDVDPVRMCVQYPTGNKEAEEKLLAELKSYEDEMTALLEMDFAVTVEPLTIHDSENIKIAGKDIGALEGIVTFED